MRITESLTETVIDARHYLVFHDIAHRDRRSFNQLAKTCFVLKPDILFLLQSIQHAIEMTCKHTDFISALHVLPLERLALLGIACNDNQPVQPPSQATRQSGCDSKDKQHQQQGKSEPGIGHLTQIGIDGITCHFYPYPTNVTFTCHNRHSNIYQIGLINQHPLFSFPLQQILTDFVTEIIADILKPGRGQHFTCRRQHGCKPDISCAGNTL